FSETLDPESLVVSNFVLTGSGRGTLAANPDTVSFAPTKSAVPVTYSLAWSTGSQTMGDDITVTVTGVQDIHGNTILNDGVGNSITLIGASLPVVLDQFGVE